MSTEFIIEIDKFFFRIISKNLNESRDIVNIYSSSERDALTEQFFDETKIKKFSVYLSFSELGCFRLCLLRSGYYEKGLFDYIQQTFIHIKLQEFIHDNYKELKVTNHIEFCNDNDNDFKKYRPKLNHINDEERIIKLEPFLNYHEKFQCGNDIQYSETIINNELISFSKILEKKYTCKEQDNIYIFTHAVNNAENDYKLKYYKINFIEKDKNNTDILLYYYIVKIKKFKNKELPESEIFYVPLFLTTNDHEITEFGTSNKYIIAGNYICKLFDYTTQCSKDIKLDTQQCFGTYVLIGNRYNDIFPFNKIKDFKTQYNKTNSQTDSSIIFSNYIDVFNTQDNNIRDLKNNNFYKYKIIDSYIKN